MITEEKCETLKQWAELYIVCGERVVEKSPLDSSAKAHLDLLRIALASLKAEPELWEVINPGEGTFYTPHGPRDFEEVDTLWYRVPPAYELKAVDLGQCDYIQGSEGTFLKEIDVLNAIKQAGYEVTDD